MKLTRHFKFRKDKTGSKNSITKEILMISIVTLVITIAITLSYTIINFNKMIIEVSGDKASTSIKYVEKEIQSIKGIVEEYASEISTNQIIIDSSKNKNKNNIQSYLNDLKSGAEDVRNFTVTDADGKIIASTNPAAKQGQDLSDNPLIKAAINGKYGSDIGRVSSEYFSAVAISPIYDNSRVTGFVLADYNIENTAFVDNIKSFINSDITIFEDDVRINTTVIQDGERLTGTKLDADIAETVLTNKQEYAGKADVFGTTFITVYKPILSFDGRVVGVLLAGSDYSVVEKQIFHEIILISIICIMSIALSIFILQRYFKKRVKNPLDSVVEAARSIETGEINEDTINSLNQITKSDEIGSLARSMEGAVKSFNLLSENINGYKNAIINHDLTYTSNSSKQSGIYLTIANIVDTLFSELRNILIEINQASEGIDAGAEHVSSAAQVLAQGATEQASSTEEMAATISDISEQVKTEALSAADASKLSDETGKEVLKSSQYMNDMMKAMEEISHASKEIEKIIKTIDDIAFQTNILALNAAVEAARAGLAGKGFSVVADEVRNLASKSAEAAKGTTLLIESAVSAVEKGYQIARDTESSLKSAVDITNKTNSLINEIADASLRQSDSLYQVNIGVEQISGVVQANSATAEEIAASSEELSGQANSLKEMVGIYRLYKSNEAV